MGGLSGVSEPKANCYHRDATSLSQKKGRPSVDPHVKTRGKLWHFRAGFIA